MLTEQNIKLFKKLGLPVYDEDEVEELPFEDVEEEKTKEEIYSYIRDFAKALQAMGAGPYTMFTYKDKCNSLARRGANWHEYLAVCSKYAETQMREMERKERYGIRQKKASLLDVWD